MKIKIEFELKEEEIPKVTELLKVLNSLTEKVQITESNEVLLPVEFNEENMKENFETILISHLSKGGLGDISQKLSQTFIETPSENLSKIFYESLMKVLQNDSLILKQIPIQNYVYIIVHSK